MKKSILLTTILANLGVFASWWFWSAVPASMPVHWGLNGKPDGFMAKEIGLWLFPAVIFVVPVVVWGLLWLDPRRRHVDDSRGAITWMLNALAVFLLGLHLITLRAATTPGMALSSETVIALVAGMFILFGAAMPRLKSNWFVGIRTPWTLSSEAVWQKTHRLGGWSFGIGGAIVIPAVLFLPQPAGFIVAMATFVLAALIPVLLSYIYYRQDTAH